MITGHVNEGFVNNFTVFVRVVYSADFQLVRKSVVLKFIETMHAWSRVH